jgi:transposase InsO family protein
MDQQGVPRWERWGQFRYSIIGGLLASPPEGGALTEALRELSQKRYRHPIDPDRWVQYGFSTLERWFHKARHAADPVAVLGRKVRADAGQSRALAPELLAALESLYRHYPEWSVQLHYKNLAAWVEAEPERGPLPSYQTVRRAMRQRGWVRRRRPRSAPTPGQERAAERLEKREVRSFEVSHVHALWHLDFHHGSRKVVDAAGHWHVPVALAILDDRSRLCCHLQWYLAETAEVLVHGLVQALAKRGLPRALLSDNGAAMLAAETRNGLARLGVAHETTLPYSPYQNGKQESFWAVVESQCLALLGRVAGLTLAFLNRASQAWVEFDYNQAEHSELSATPLERLLAGPDVSRPAPGSEPMRLAFTRRAVRTQRRSDGTISVGGVRFEVPSRFRPLGKLAVRYRDWDKSHVHLVDPRTGAPLATLLPLDKEKNADGRRRTLEPIEDTPTPAAPAPDPIPPLLAQLLAQYAATGLPPAYVPKEELEQGEAALEAPAEETRHDR